VLSPDRREVTVDPCSPNIPHAKAKYMNPDQLNRRFGALHQRFHDALPAALVLALGLSTVVACMPRLAKAVLFNKFHTLNKL